MEKMTITGREVDDLITKLIAVRDSMKDCDRYEAIISGGPYISVIAREDGFSASSWTLKDRKMVAA